jgi:DNA-binding response OmpR family regulator
MDKEHTVLIVDDRPTERDTLEALLATEDYRLEFAGDGRQALDRAAELTPDLILLDVMMPELDGFEVCQRLRSDPLLAEVPVVLVTALDDRDSRIRGIESGADDFVSKPFDRHELRARVRSLTKLNRYRRLLLERSKLDWVMEQTEAGYVIIDEQDRLEYANAQARVFLDLPAVDADQASDSDISKQTFLDLVRHQFHLNPEESWTTWPSTQGDGDFPIRYLVRPESATANSFWLQVTSLEVPSHPVGKHLVCLRDVTNEINQRLDLGSFHSAISHKVRTPINGILGTLRVLADEESELDREQAAQLARLATDSAERLHLELQQVLQFLEMSHTARDERRGTTSRLGQLLDEIGGRLQIRSLTVSIQPELGDCTIAMSPQATELVLSEVLENAVKFHPTGSPAIEVRLGITNGGQLKIQVIDDGISLSPAQLADVWRPYHQAEKWFTGQVPGMGLGLPMVALLVWSAGGSCRILNREQQSGVVVELSIPLASEV